MLRAFNGLMLLAVIVEEKYILIKNIRYCQKILFGCFVTYLRKLYKPVN